MGIKIAFLGDIAVFDHGLLEKDWKYILKEAHDYLSQFECVVANLEVPITDESKTTVVKGIHLKTDRRIIEILKYLHITHVNLGNNHIYDFGEKGVADTVEMLKKYGIHYFGIGTMPGYLDLDRNISFHSFCCYSTNGAGYNKIGGVIPLTEKAVIEALNSDEINERFSVLCFHWGDEYSSYPNAKQVDFYHRVAKRRDVFIHGSHTHVMQGIEAFNGSLCAYSSGNFLMDDCVSATDKRVHITQNEFNMESFIISIEVDNNTIKNSFIIGIHYDGNSFKLIDNSSKLEELSNNIANCHTDDYISSSMLMIKEAKANNLGRKDLYWLLRKMNYNSIAAKIISYINKRKFDRAY